MPPTSAQAIAATVSESMYRDDGCAALLDIEPVAVVPGSAVMRMPVRKDMANGGPISTLADTAFAHACNSYNVVGVAAGCSIEFLLPAQIGDWRRTISWSCAAWANVEYTPHNEGADLATELQRSCNVVVSAPQTLPRSLGKAQRVVDKRR